MEVILLERIEKLGQMGDVVKVKAGFARNYLLPQKKALRATDSNRGRFEQQRSQLEATNLARRQEAQAIAGKVDGLTVVLIRQAGETAQLYGSVSARDVALAVSEAGVTVERRQVLMDRPIKTLGLHLTSIALHPEVIVKVTLNVARSGNEAERQLRGEDVTVVKEEKLELETFNPEMFEEGAAPAAEAREPADEAAEGEKA